MRKNLNLYCIDKNNRKLKALGHDISMWPQDILKHSEYKESKFFNNQVKLICNDSSIKNSVLYFRKKEKLNTWFKFFENHVDEEQDFEVFKSLSPIPLDFICFLMTEANVYVFTAGSGYYLVKEFIKENFGIDILTRVVDKGELELSQLTERHISGKVLSSRLSYRSGTTLDGEWDLGKLRSNITSKTQKQILDDLFEKIRIDLEGDDYISFIAKDSLEIKRAFSYIELEQLIVNIEKIYLKYSEPKFEINGLKEIGNMSFDDDLIRRVNNLALTACHKSFYELDVPNTMDIVPLLAREELFFPDRIVIRQNRKTKIIYEEPVGLQDAKTILNKIKRHLSLDDCNSNLSKDYDLDEFDEFKKLFTSLKIDIHVGDEFTTYSLLELLNIEVYCEELKQSFFKIEKKWYELSHTWKEKLQELSEKALDITYWDDHPLVEINWAKKENEYDLLAKLYDVENVILGHTIKVKNIELFDFIYFDENTTYFIHAKKGFESQFRTAAQQLIQAAQLIEYDCRVKDQSILKEWYQKWKSKGAANVGTGVFKTYYNNFKKHVIDSDLTEQDFLKLCSPHRKHVYCIALSNPPTVKDCEGVKFENLRKKLKTSQSNIAKMSLVSLRSSLRGLVDSGEGLQIIEFKWIN